MMEAEVHEPRVAVREESTNYVMYGFIGHSKVFGF